MVAIVIFECQKSLSGFEGAIIYIVNSMISIYLENFSTMNNIPNQEYVNCIVYGYSKQ